MAYVRADTPRDQLRKLGALVERLLQPGLLSATKAKKHRIAELMRDIKILKHQLGEDDLRYIEQLRKDVDDFYLANPFLKDVTKKKSEVPIYYGHIGTSVTTSYVVGWGNIMGTSLGAMVWGVSV